MKESKDGFSNLITFRPNKEEKERAKILHPYYFSWDNANFRDSQILRIGLINYGTEGNPFVSNPFSIYNNAINKSSVILIAERQDYYGLYEQPIFNFVAFFVDAHECSNCKRVREINKINLVEFGVTMENYKDYFEKIGEQILNKCYIQNERGEIFYNLFIPQAASKNV